MNIQVYRVNKSSYQDGQFFKHEKSTLESIEGVKYISSLSEISQDLPFILLTNTHTIPQEIPEVILDNTLLVVHPNSGYDNYPVSFVKNASFPIIIGNPIRSHAVVEYTLSCIFHHYTTIYDHKHWSSNRNWNRKLVRDQKILIIGHGHIGKMLHASLAPICKKTVVFDPYEKLDLLSFEQVKDWQDSMMDDVDILILACSLNEKNLHFINYDKLKRLSSNSLIINASRGELINESDLIQFLQKNPNSKCYLDVFEKEPFSPGYLYDVKNLNKTSHIAGVYEDLNSDIIEFEFNIINDFIKRNDEKRTDLFLQDYKHCILKNKISDNMII